MIPSDGELAVALPLGDLIAALYEAALERYGEEELAATVTAAEVNRFLLSRDSPDQRDC